MPAESVCLERKSGCSTQKTQEAARKSIPEVSVQKLLSKSERYKDWSKGSASAEKRAGEPRSERATTSVTIRSGR